MVLFPKCIWHGQMEYPIFPILAKVFEKYVLIDVTHIILYSMDSMNLSANYSFTGKA